MKFDGGKAVVQRILQAYGFTMQKQLHDHLGVGNGTVSTWIKRNYFPGEVVIRCALETGADLEWLATGDGNLNLSNKSEKNKLTIEEKIKSFILAEGKLIDNDYLVIDKLLFEKKEISKIIYVSANTESWFFDIDVKNIINGLWLVVVDGVTDIYHLTRIPKERIKLIKDFSTFECNIQDVKLIGKAIIHQEFL